MKPTTRLIVLILMGSLAFCGAVGGAVGMGTGIETGLETGMGNGIETEIGTGAQGDTRSVSTGSSATPSPYLLAQTQMAAVSFEDVSPIFSMRCVMCHSGPKAPHNLRLDNYGNIVKGGKKGPVLVPGKPAASEIVRRIRGQSKPRMPMNGPPWLTEDETRLIEQWISGGAAEGKPAA